MQLGHRDFFARVFRGSHDVGQVGSYREGWKPWTPRKGDNGSTQYFNDETDEAVQQIAISASGDMRKKLGKPSLVVIYTQDE